MEEIKKYIINEQLIDKRLTKERYDKAVNIIKDYIIKNKLIIYGGFALNEYLSNKNKIYSADDVPDFDCISKNASKDIMKIADALYLAGYKYIKITAAEHPNTFRLSVDFKYIIDVSTMPSSLYNTLIFNFNKDLKEINHIKTKYILVPINYVKSELYKELSRPIASLFRWDKLFKRMQLIHEEYKIIINKKIKKTNQKNAFYNPALDFAILNKYPLIGEAAINLYMADSQCVFSYVSILSDNIENTVEEFKKLLVDIPIRVKHINSDGYIPSKRVIFVNNVKTLEIIDASAICVSITKLKGKKAIVVCTSYAILSFLYMDSVINIKNSNHDMIIDKIHAFEKFINETMHKHPKQNINKKCYGLDKPRIVKQKEGWDVENVIFKSKINDTKRKL
jgi:hypothetical protein